MKKQNFIKVVSLIFALVMLISVIPMAFTASAADINASENLALSAKAEANSSHAVGPVANLNDGNYTNRWTRNDGIASKDVWCQLVWDNPVTFNSVTLYEWPQELRTRAFTLSVSDNGEDFTPVYTGTTIGQKAVVYLDQSVTAKYLRLVITEAVSDWPSIAEIEVKNSQNLAAFATPEAHNSHSAGPIANLNDGNYTNRWTHNGDVYTQAESWCQLVWDNPVTFNYIALYEWNNQYKTNAFELYTSDNGVDFEKIYTGGKIGAKGEVFLDEAVSAKYLRLYITDANWTSISEMEVGYIPKNIAPDATASAFHSHAGGQRPPMSINDGNYTNRWTMGDPYTFDFSGSDLFWCQLAWDEIVTIDSVTIYEYTDSYTKARIGDFELQTSLDGVEYNTVYSDSRVGSYKVIDLDSPVSTKYLRLVIKSGIDGMNAPNIAEIEAFNKSGENVHVHTEEIIPGKAATCTESGLTDGKKCSDCGVIYVQQKVIDALGHKAAEAVKENVKNATCAVDGSYDSVVYCSVCNTELSRKTETVAATGDHVYATEQEKKDATCTESGYVIMACGCGATQTTTIDAIGHTNAEAVKENEKAATCTADGSYDLVVYCSVCNAEISRTTETVTALGHTEAADSAVAPTCTETGLTAGKHCSVCNAVIVAQETVDALGHTEGDAVVENTVASSCAVAGSFDNVIYCTVCNAEVSRRTVSIPALGHTEVVDKAVAATCTEAGKTEGKHCSVCNEVLVAQEIVDALGHNEVVDAAVAPTCTEAGKSEGKHCSVCNEVLVAQEIVDALGHDWQDATTEAPKTCKNCGATEGDKLPTPEVPDEPEQPETPDEPNNAEPNVELNIFQKIWLMIVNFFKKLFGIK